MKTILVTGGTGFIGNCFCKLLLEERPEYRVINVDVCTYAANPSTILQHQIKPCVCALFPVLHPLGLAGRPRSKSTVEGKRTTCEYP